MSFSYTSRIHSESANSLVRTGRRIDGETSRLRLPTSQVGERNGIESEFALCSQPQLLGYQTFIAGK